MTGFVLALHSHLPYVMNHGRWPHGSDWLCEATLDTYLPLLEELLALEAAGVPAPVTMGVTPVLANQLADPAFASEMESFLAQRILACDEAPRSLAGTGDSHLEPLARFWRGRFERLRALFQRLGGNLIPAFRRLAESGRLELISSAATHGFLPLLARDESIALQLVAGRMEHQRLFGRPAAGCWLPECAYRRGGQWKPLPDAPRGPPRRGIEEHLADAGYRYFFVDAHLAEAGHALGTYTDVPLGAERFDAVRHDRTRHRRRRASHSPYHAYRVSRPDSPVTAFVRDPESSMQVWSRHQGYPGDEWYLEFHKIRWPGGLKFWRVSASGSDLGQKQPYDPSRAFSKVADHAAHFAGLLGSIAGKKKASGGVIVAPFDTELYGHWWFEGVPFLGHLYRRLATAGSPRPATASQHLAAQASALALDLAEGSWGAGGDNRMWLNPGTEWTWRRLWKLEQRFWDVAPGMLHHADARGVLAQAARSLLLAQSSDWQFIISTGAVADYGERRFSLHADDCERLLEGLTGSATEEARARSRDLAAELSARDALFPDILTALATVAAG